MLNGRSRIEALMDILRDGPYFTESRVDNSGRLSHLFFALDDALDLFGSNSDVIIMDCTYKTNTFGLPLLNIIGVSGMNTTLHLAQAFLQGEAEPDFSWALAVLRRALALRATPMPQVIFVDRDEVLLNALEVGFPGTPVQLCLWHIIKDVEAHARQHGLPQVHDPERSRPRTPKWKDSTAHREFCDAFILLTRSQTKAEYEERRTRLHELCPVEAIYIDETWLDIWKSKIVRCWTNNVVYFGIQTTSRVEGYHAAMERWLLTSAGDLLTIFSRMKLWWEQSLVAHRGEVSDSQIKMAASLRGRVYGRVVRVIHNYALKECVKQLTSIRTSACSGIYTQTTGLPCYHRLRRLMNDGEALTPTDFHPHWWIDRTTAPPAVEPRVLEPLTIAERRELRRQQRRGGRARARGRGSGPRGTRRDPSRFEITSEQYSHSFVGVMLPPCRQSPYHSLARHSLLQGSLQCDCIGAQ